ncbi:TetR/AcrR family transcriptional regulator [Labrenzia sp. 011]|uniref:TetR/AcrR family transcriptional regulator n=1 Tax=Labrenzia sp. 011 TaxID=2171494 RepID=UPI000D50D5DB|nr:TetR/AcrR family transcriptional regulator [Labrenzia sp. 011]PVB60311.1 TetR family transcriptional regulator [Labrenzia sp. 011]
MATAKTRQKILQTFLDLLSEHPYEDVSLPMIAAAAKVKLSDMRSAFASKLQLVAAFTEKIDTAVLDGVDEDMGDQPPRDRLFDVLMTRIDVLAAHKEAVRALHVAARHDPALALDFNRLEVRSQKWMLIAAGIDVSGVKATIVAQGLAVAFARVVGVWLEEDDEGMPRTMARLDKELDKGGSFMKRLNGLERAAKGVRSLLKRISDRPARRRPRADEDDGEPDLSDKAPAGA